MLINEQEPIFHALESHWAWLPLFLRAVILRGLSDAVFSFTCGWRDGKSEWAGDQEIWASYRFGHRGVMMEGAVRMLSHGVNHTSMERRECHHALGLELTFLCSGPAEWFGTPSTTRLPIRRWNYTELHWVGIFRNVMGNVWMCRSQGWSPNVHDLFLNILGLRKQHFSHYPLIMMEVFCIQKDRFGFKGFNRIKISIHSKPDRLRWYLFIYD